MITLKELTDEVERLLRDGYEFREACRKVLENHGITGDWNYYFSRIDQMFPTRRNRKRKMDVTKVKNKKPAVQQRPVSRFASNTDADFDGLSPQETLQKLADSDF